MYYYGPNGDFSIHPDPEQPAFGEDSFLGLPAWSVAISVCLVASVLTVFGFVLQKRGSRATDPWCQIGDMVISRDWVLGLLLFFCTGAPMDLLAYSIAPLSLTSPLSGVTVALNQVLAPRLLGEHTEVFPDYLAAGLIVVGTLFTTLSGPRHDPIYNTDMLWGNLREQTFLWFMGMLTIMVGFCMFLMRMMTEKLRQSSLACPANPNVLEVLLPAVAAGGAGAITNIMLKAVGVLLRSGASHAAIMPWVVLTAAPAALQLNYISRGLKFYPQTVFMPIYQAILVVMTLLASSAFYKEYRELGLFPERFTGGLLALVAGILMFSLRSGHLPPEHFRAKGMASV